MNEKTKDLNDYINYIAFIFNAPLALEESYLVLEEGFVAVDVPALVDGDTAEALSLLSIVSRWLSNRGFCIYPDDIAAALEKFYEYFYYSNEEE